MYESVGHQSPLILGVSIVGASLACFLLTGSPLSALILLLLQALVALNCYGVLWYGGVKLNVISLANIVIINILTLYLSVPLTKAFDMSSSSSLPPPALKPVRRAQVAAALVRYGSAVLHTLIAGLLFLIPLAASQSYIFSSFFKLWIAAIFFNAFYALCVLPLFLRYIGLPSD